VSGYAAPAIRMHGCVPFLPCGVTRVVGRAGMRKLSEADNLLFIIICNGVCFVVVCLISKTLSVLDSFVFFIKY
jgi:hypothetical protein